MDPRTPEELSALCARGDAMWAHMRREAEDALRLDPSLTPLMLGAILNRASLEEAVVQRIAARLGASAMDAEELVLAIGRIQRAATKAMAMLAEVL